MLRERIWKSKIETPTLVDREEDVHQTMTKKLDLSLAPKDTLSAMTSAESCT